MTLRRDLRHRLEGAEALTPEHCFGRTALVPHSVDEPPAALRATRAREYQIGAAPVSQMLCRLRTASWSHTRRARATHEFRCLVTDKQCTVFAGEAGRWVSICLGRLPIRADACLKPASRLDSSPPTRRSSMGDQWEAATGKKRAP